MLRLNLESTLSFKEVDLFLQDLVLPKQMTIPPLIVQAIAPLKALAMQMAGLWDTIKAQPSVS
jgi:hypothetical protein